MELKGPANPIVFCSAVFKGSNTCICNSNFWPNGVIPTLRGRKVRYKMWSKFQNCLEVLKWHEYDSVGEVRCENEIHDFFPFDPFFSQNGHLDFLTP